MAKDKLEMEMALQKIEGKYLMRDDKITYELRKYNLSELSQKFLFGIMYKISADFIEPTTKTLTESSVNLEYKISFEEVKENINVDYRIESDKRKIKSLAKELINTPIEISIFNEKNKIKEIVNTNLIEKIILSNDKNSLYIHIDERILPLYKAVAGKFTLWGFDYIILSEKKYTPRLYELLIEFAKSIGTKNINGLISKTILVDDLYYELSIPKSYNYGMMKERVVEVCKSEFLALNYEEDREKFKLFKSFDYVENLAKRRSTAGRRGVESITFNFELLEKTKGLLTGKKGIEATNPEKLEARDEMNKIFYAKIGLIIQKLEKDNSASPALFFLAGDEKQKQKDFVLRIADIRNEILKELNLKEIKDIAFEKGLTHTLKNLRSPNIEDFEYDLRKSLKQNIEYWKDKEVKK